MVSVAGLKTLTLEFSPRRNARAAPWKLKKHLPKSGLRPDTTSKSVEDFVPVPVPAAADSRHLRNAEKYDMMRKTNAKAEMPRRLLHFMDF